MLDPFAYQHSNPESRGLVTRHWNICLTSASWIQPTYSEGKTSLYIRGLRGAAYVLVAVDHPLDDLFNREQFDKWTWMEFLLEENNVM